MIVAYLRRNAQSVGNGEGVAQRPACGDQRLDIVDWSVPNIANHPIGFGIDHTIGRGDLLGLVVGRFRQRKPRARAGPDVDWELWKWRNPQPELTHKKIQRCGVVVLPFKRDVAVTVRVQHRKPCGVGLAEGSAALRKQQMGGKVNRAAKQWELAEHPSNHPLPVAIAKRAALGSAGEDAGLGFVAVVAISPQRPKPERHPLQSPRIEFGCVWGRFLGRGLRSRNQ
ncbi:MAG: hypothetical protein DYG96_06245 [Chlorobi bacterium CHB2]|nr:hypothetical protein [Chlorobi bacterium CHB2]